MANQQTSSDEFSFDDLFHELDDDLDREALEWQVHTYYFDDGDEETQERGEAEVRPSQSHSSVNTTTEAQSCNPSHIPSLGDLPAYLAVSSLSFQVAFFCELRHLYQPIDVFDLQQLTFLTHQMSMIHLHQQLWRRFLQACTGQLKPRALWTSSQSASDAILSFRPSIMTSLLRSRHGRTAPHSDDIGQDTYVDFIHSYLQRLEKKVEHCRARFNVIKARMPSYTDALADKIDQFVQKHGLQAARLHIQARIALTERICTDRSYQLEFLRQKPTPSQLDIGKEICLLTLARERAQQELLLLKFGVLPLNFRKAWDQLQVSLTASTMTTVLDSAIRERLSNEYLGILQRASTDLVGVYTKAAEFKRIECQKLFETKTADMWKTQRALPADERLSSTMVTLIEERQQNIIECVKNVYTLRNDLFLLPPPKAATTTSN